MPELVQKGTKFKLRIKLNHKYSTVLLTFFLSLFSCFQMMKELAKMNGAEIQNLYLFQSISPLVIRKWEKIFCETYYLIWWGTACIKKTLAYLYSWVIKHNYVIILGVGGVGVLAIMAYTGRLHPKGFPFLGHVAAAWKRSQQWCLTLTPNKNWNNWKNDLSLFSANNQERPSERLLHNCLFQAVGIWKPERISLAEERQDERFQISM